MNKTVSDSGAGRITDVDEARIAALAEHEQREALLARLADLRRQVDQAVEAERAVQRLVNAVLDKDDDGPGRDQCGPHERGPAVTVAHGGQPSPDASAVARQGDADLETRVRNLMYEHKQGFTSPRLAARQVIAAVRGASPAAYSDRLTLHADDLDVPEVGPRWQILDAGDEDTWRDLLAVAECQDADCPVVALATDEGEDADEVECIVLVSDAWEDGEAHMPADTMVDVRIPAATA